MFFAQAVVSEAGDGHFLGERFDPIGAVFGSGGGMAGEAAGNFFEARADGGELGRLVSEANVDAHDDREQGGANRAAVPRRLW